MPIGLVLRLRVHSGQWDSILSLVFRHLVVDVLILVPVMACVPTVIPDDRLAYLREIAYRVSEISISVLDLIPVLTRVAWSTVGLGLNN